MGAGFGTLPHGTGSFGTQQVSDLFLTETATIAEALAVSVPFKVASAISLSKTLVKLDFTGFVDPDHPTNFDAANYTISGLVVSNVDPYGLTKSVLIQTSTQSHVNYTVVVNPTAGQVQGIGGDQLNPSFNTAVFLGDMVPATFTAVAQSRRKIRLNFSQPMLFNGAFLDPANILLTGFDGNGILLEDVEQVGPSGTKFQLTLAEDLVPFANYVLQISSQIQTQAGDFVFPDRGLVQWQEVIPRPIRIEIASFSGEVTGGLLGQPDGQVFFSPAFDVSSPNSILEVDSVSVCTRAYDVYTIPSLPDPQILYTFPAPSGTNGNIGASGGRLRASASRLGLATTVVSDFREETMPQAADEPAEGLLVEPIDITKASFLNDDRWRIFPDFILGVPGVQLVDGQTFTLNDGVNARTRFEFNSGGGVAAGNVAVAFTSGDSAGTVAAALQTAINGVGATLNISALSPIGAKVPLTNSTPVLNQAFRTAANLALIGPGPTVGPFSIP